MRLMILGSGTNVHPQRAAAGYLVQTDQLLLLDFGPRTLANLMKAGMNRHQIRYILFSHFHADHFADFIHFFFDAVFYSKFIGTRPDLTLIGPRGTRQLFGVILKTFPGFNTAAFHVSIREISNRSFRLGETRITPRTVVHSPRLHCVGYRIEHRGKVLAYSGDAMTCEERDRYDAIAVTAALPVYDPRFERALRIDGRLFVIVGEAPVMEAMLVRRVSASEWLRESLFETVVETLVHAPRPPRFVF